MIELLFCSTISENPIDDFSIRVSNDLVALSIPVSEIILSTNCIFFSLRFRIEERDVVGLGIIWFCSKTESIRERAEHFNQHEVNGSSCCIAVFAFDNANCESISAFLTEVENKDSFLSCI